MRRVVLAIAGLIAIPGVILLAIALLIVAPSVLLAWPEIREWAD